MKGQFEGKVVIVVGASSGIGKGAAVDMAGKGAKLVLQGRDESRLSAAVDQCISTPGCRGAVGVVGDVSTSALREELIRTTLDKWGRVDVLVYCAVKTSPRKGIYEETEESFDAQFGVNCRAPFFLIQSLVPHLEATKGNILLVSSITASTPQPFMHLYAVGKYITDHMAKSLAVELGPRGIRVNTTNPTVTPGTLGLREHTEALGFDFMEFSEKWSNTLHPLYQRCATIQEQVDAIVFLCSEEASFVTGQNLYVDGGYTIAKGVPPPARDVKQE